MARSGATAKPGDSTPAAPHPACIELLGLDDPLAADGRTNLIAFFSILAEWQQKSLRIEKEPRAEGRTA